MSVVRFSGPRSTSILLRITHARVEQVVRHGIWRTTRAWREYLAPGERWELQGEREVGREDDGRQDSQAGGQIFEGAVQQDEPESPRLLVQLVRLAVRGDGPCLDVHA